MRSHLTKHDQAQARDWERPIAPHRTEVDRGSVHISLAGDVEANKKITIW
jgi:hypothetical protein